LSHCGRSLTLEDIELIRQIIASNPLSNPGADFPGYLSCMVLVQAGRRSQKHELQGITAEAAPIWPDHPAGTQAY